MSAAGSLDQRITACLAIFAVFAPKGTTAGFFDFVL
jgi:hypothetical protein